MLIIIKNNSNNNNPNIVKIIKIKKDFYCTTQGTHFI